MSTLKELDDAVIELSRLSLVCPKNQKEEILKKRDVLDSQASDLAKRTLKEGTKELSDAIGSLNALTESAIKYKEDINKLGKTIIKIADIIDKATIAAGKIAALIA